MSNTVTSPQHDHVPSDFENELRELINRKSREGRSDTHDFILARFLESCLVAFEVATVSRDFQYGFRPEIPQTNTNQ